MNSCSCKSPHLPIVRHEWCVRTEEEELKSQELGCSRFAVRGCFVRGCWERVEGWHELLSSRATLTHVLLRRDIQSVETLANVLVSDWSTERDFLRRNFFDLL